MTNDGQLDTAVPCVSAPAASLSTTTDSDDKIISWEDKGRGFKVYAPRAFNEHVMPRYAQGKRKTRYRSFQRQLNIYGFRMEKKSGIYYHPSFYRGCDVASLRYRIRPNPQKNTLTKAKNGKRNKVPVVVASPPSGSLLLSSSPKTMAHQQQKKKKQTANTTTTSTSTKKTTNKSSTAAATTTKTTKRRTCKKQKKTTTVLGDEWNPDSGTIVPIALSAVSSSSSSSLINNDYTEYYQHNSDHSGGDFLDAFDDDGDWLLRHHDIDIQEDELQELIHEQEMVRNDNNAGAGPHFLVEKNINEDFDNFMDAGATGNTCQPNMNDDDDSSIDSNMW